MTEPQPTAADATVVVPTFRRAASLARLLSALAEQIRPPRQVVVVDDASPDDTASTCEAIARSGPPFALKHVRQRRNLGPAAARNLGVAHAEHDLVLFTDDDCEPDPQWAGALVAALEKDPTLAGVGGPVRAAGDSRFDDFFDEHRLLDAFRRSPGAEPLYLVTANAAFRREWILRVGGFDEALRRPGGEDPGLSFKIARTGGRLGFVESALVRHHYPDTWRAFARMFWNYGYGGCLVARAHAGVA